ncbi:MAG: diacylglycerol kinase family protein [Ginsengibacter sp.]
MRFLNSAMHAVRGLLYCFQHEKNFLVQFVLAVIVFFAGIFFGLTSQEWLAILLSTAIVLGMEIINTAIERLCDVITTSIHPAIKQVKDIAAGGVLLVSAISLATGCIIFIPRIISIIKKIS